MKRIAYHQTKQKEGIKPDENPLQGFEGD